MDIRIFENQITHSILLTQVIEDNDDHWVVKNPVNIFAQYIDEDMTKYAQATPPIVIPDIIKDSSKGDMKILSKNFYNETLNEYDDVFMESYREFQVDREQSITADDSNIIQTEQ